MSKTILLVEDEALIALREQQDLEQYGYTVLCVTNGETAIETVVRGKSKIDLVLMDINLGPGMDGTQTAEKILEHRDIPIVFLSSHTEPAVVKKTEKITSYGYIVKNTGITVLDASIKMAFKLHEAKTEMRESNERFRLAVDETGEGIWDWNMLTGEVHYDENWTRFLGYDPETEKYTYAAWEQRIHPDSISVFEKALQDYLEGRRKYFEYEYQIRTKSGEWKWVWSRGICIESDRQNKPVRFIGTHRDISDRKISEERVEELARFRGSVLENDLVWINALDGEGNVTFWNKAAERISGYSAEEVIGHGKIWEWLYPDEEYRSRVYDLTRGIIEQGIRDENSETTISRKDRQRRVILWNSQHLKDDAGKVVGSIALGVDVTERKKGEETITRQLREKEVLLREIHHRIKNNIASIESLLKIQAGSTENIEAKSIIANAVNRVGSIRKIYDKLLLADNYRELHVGGYLQELVQSVVDIFPDKHKIDLHFEIDDFVLDVNKLFLVGTILNELVTNSMKYAFRRGNPGRIDIALIKRGCKIVLTVKDNGSGLPSGFDSKKTEGFGMMLVRMLTEQLEGSFSMESNNGLESTVTFSLPSTPASFEGPFPGADTDAGGEPV